LCEGLCLTMLLRSFLLTLVFLSGGKHLPGV
jgi:hypothetical protein